MIYQHVCSRASVSPANSLLLIHLNGLQRDFDSSEFSSVCFTSWPQTVVSLLCEISLVDINSHSNTIHLKIVYIPLGILASLFKPSFFYYPFLSLYTLDGDHKTSSCGNPNKPVFLILGIDTGFLFANVILLSQFRPFTRT